MRLDSPNTRGGFIQEVVILVLLTGLIAGAAYWYYYLNSQHNPLAYVDPQYGYSLAFPASWDGYLIKRQGDEEQFGFVVDYGTSLFEPLFYIGITNSSVWGQNVGGVGEPAGDTYIGTVNGEVYHYGVLGDANAPTLDEQNDAVPAIIASFALPSSTQPSAQ